MKAVSIIFRAMILLMIIVNPGCKKSGDDNQSSTSKGYEGSLFYEYSRDFPAFNSKVEMAVHISSAGVMTCGPSVSSPINADDTLYDNGKPTMRMRMTGSMTLHETTGTSTIVGNEEVLLALIHSTIQYQVTVWTWDDQSSSWIQVLDTPSSYSDEYSDGAFQFSIAEACMGTASIKTTLPDVQGTFTYGYTLFLIPNP